jgi:hypothetical protein
VNPRTKQIAIALAALLLSLFLFLATRPETDNANARLTSHSPPAKPKTRSIQTPRHAPAHSIPPATESDEPAQEAPPLAIEDPSRLTGKILNDDGEVSDEFFRHFDFTDQQIVSFKAVIRSVMYGSQYIESRNVEVLPSTDGSTRFMVHPFRNLGNSLIEELPKIFKRFPNPPPDAAIDYFMTEATSGREDFFAGFGQYPREFRVVRDGGEYVMTETFLLPGPIPDEPVRTNGPVRRFTKLPARYAHFFEPPRQYPHIFKDVSTNRTD